MTDTINEQVSAFTDGELPDAERELLLKRMASDAELKATWQRYHLVRDALREDLPEFILKEHDTDYISDENTEVRRTSAGVFSMQRLLKPLAGIAVAASVATLAVVGVLHNTDQLAEPEHTLASGASTSDVVVPEQFIVVPRSGWQSAKPAVVSHLNSYLVDHSSYAGFGSAQGIIPYSRVAGYDDPMPDEELKEDASKASEKQK